MTVAVSPRDIVTVALEVLESSTCQDVILTTVKNSKSKDEIVSHRDVCLAAIGMACNRIHCSQDAITTAKERIIDNSNPTVEIEEFGPVIWTLEQTLAQM